MINVHERMDKLYGGVDKLAGRVVAAYAHGLMVRTFPCNVATYVGHVT
jgi:hypothetical protein